jgi:hypothetical protein
MINQGQLFTSNLLFLALIVVWTVFWKGYSLWTSARAGQKYWFIAILLINTFGLLEIIYIFAVAKKTLRDIGSLFVWKKSEKPQEKKEESK